MSKKEYQNVDLEIVLFLDDLIRTSGDFDETDFRLTTLCLRLAYKRKTYFAQPIKMKE